MAGGGGDGYRSLEHTPTWALATVCFVFIALSLLIEHLIHLVSHWLQKHKKNSLVEAVEKLKSVMIVLGFMSLILTVTQKSIAKICIPNAAAATMLPCRKSQPETEEQEEDDYCAHKGKTALITEAGLNQLSIFLFVMAATQIVYSVLTMALGRAKMRRWKAWERETQTVEYEAANDPNRFRYARQTTFARRHMNCTTTVLHLWIKCFFRQFFNSVAKVDYLTLRHGFIAAHLSNNNSFNFQKYIEKSLDEDFKAVVGISPVMWFLVVIFMLADIRGWHIYLWVSFLPLMIVLVVGTKLEVVVANMGLKLNDRNTVIKGAPLVQPNDDYFWFNHPKFVLTLLHYTLFVNSFELAFFVWATWQFGIKSCYHETLEILVTRMVLAVMVQILCSYSTLPLYALVTQMGSRYKGVMVKEETANVLKQLHAGVKQNNKKKHKAAGDVSPTGRSFPSSPLSSRIPDFQFNQSASHSRSVDSSLFQPPSPLSSGLRNDYGISNRGMMEMGRTPATGFDEQRLNIDTNPHYSSEIQGEGTTQEIQIARVEDRIQ
ncbi:MLO-like protein 3 [Linum perenne]